MTWAVLLQTMLRDDYLTAMVIYFDVGFTKIHKPIWLSTGPRTSPLSCFRASPACTFLSLAPPF